MRSPSPDLRNSHCSGIQESQRRVDSLTRIGCSDIDAADTSSYRCGDRFACQGDIQQDSMSNSRTKSVRTIRGMPSVADLSRVLLHSATILVVALFSVATPSPGLLSVTESEAPLESEETAQEAATPIQTRTRFRRERFVRPVTIHGASRCMASRTADPVAGGHLLSDNASVPLRC